MVLLGHGDGRLALAHVLMLPFGCVCHLVISHRTPAFALTGNARHRRMNIGSNAPMPVTLTAFDFRTIMLVARELAGDAARAIGLPA